VRRALPGGFELDDDPARIDRDEVHRFLSQESYWARGRPREVVERLLDVSARLVGVYGADGRQLGFSRTVSDGVAVAYLADVYVHPDVRGHGLGVELVRFSVDEGPFARARWFLNTDDAHDLYERFGFGAPDATVMTRPRTERASRMASP
jgi:GNAT superfamily N-acetyltransferase